ncbi:MAG: S41 family peptidase [Chloroflexota bacterium]
MQNRRFLAVLGILVGLILLAGTCSAGFVAGRMYTGQPAAGQAELPALPGIQDLEIGPPGSDTQMPADAEALFQPFWQAWNLIVQSYVDQPVNKTVLMRGAIKGMFDALGDEHSSYMDPQMFEQSTTRLDGSEYEGIGAWVDVSGSYLKIISPMPDSPAEKAGLKANDEVIAIDGEDMTGKDGEYARQHVLGPRGTIVRLTIRREGVAEPFDVEVERGAIVVPTITYEMREDGLGYIQLLIFGDDTAADLENALNKLLDQNPKGIILDLRNNGGGYLETAIDVASQFIGDGVVMYEQYGDGSDLKEFKARRGGAATEIPLVVLINEGSASASEIVAGAVQDRGRGYMVGMQSYGKGSVQNIVPLVEEQGAVRVTIARWLTPNKRQINQLGLRPDFVVELTADELEAGKDPQLEMAVRVLLEQLLPPPTPVPSPTPTVTPVP